MKIIPEPGEDILEAVERGVPRDAEHWEEMEGKERQPEGWGCSAGGRPKRTTRTMASGTRRRSISRARWAGARCPSEHKRPQGYPSNYSTVSIERLG